MADLNVKLLGDTQRLGWASRGGFTSTADGAFSALATDGTTGATVTLGSLVAAAAGTLTFSGRGGLRATGDGAHSLLANDGTTGATLTIGSAVAAAAGSYTFTGRGGLSASSDGVAVLKDTAGTAFSRLCLGGTTSSFPSLKRSSAALHARLADDSAYANFQCGVATASNLSVATGTITTSQPVSITQAWNDGGVTFTGIQSNITSTASAAASLLLDLQVGGTSYANIRKDGQLRLGTGTTLIGFDPDSYLSWWVVAGARGGAFADGIIYLGGSGDVALNRDGANHLGIRRSTNAQKLSIYNDYVSATEYEAFAIDWQGTADVCTLTTTKGGSGGSTRSLTIRNAVNAASTIAIGPSAGLVSTAAGGTFIGESAGASCTNQANNTYIGRYVGQYGNGGANIGIGYYAYNDASGDSNIAIGTQTMWQSGASTGCIAIGTNAGDKESDGSTINATPTNSIYIGNLTRANDSSQENQIVIGQAAIGLGSNTTVIGNSSTTANTIYGDHNVVDGKNVILGTTTGTKIGTGTTQKLAFWNATPVVQQVLATGGGATVDNVITLLQTLGLCKQS